jgi:hypothetical protein
MAYLIIGFGKAPVRRRVSWDLSDSFRHLRSGFLYRPVCIGYYGFIGNNILLMCSLFRFRGNFGLQVYYKGGSFVACGNRNSCLDCLQVSVLRPLNPHKTSLAKRQKHRPAKIHLPRLLISEMDRGDGG